MGDAGQSDGSSLLRAIETLYGHQDWAMERVLVTAGGLTEAQFHAVVIPGAASLGSTLVHIAAAQRVHLAWWDGSLKGEASFAREFPPEDYAGLPEVRAEWDAVRLLTSAFLGTLVEADMGREYRRLREDGAEVVRPLWLMMLHVANHATQHRAEAAAILTALGRSPGDLDLL